ncbi:MAG: O-antigen ligase family protein [Pirellulaceae bacterium]
MRENPPKARTLGDSIQLEQLRNEAQRNPASEGRLQHWIAWPGKLAALFVVVAPPWMLGSVHSRSQWIISIALLIALASWWLETAFSRKKPQILPHLLFFVLLGLGIGLTQIISLPESLNSLLFGMQSEVYNETLAPLSKVVNESSPVAYGSLDTEATWGQIRLMTLGIIALLVGCRFFRSTSDTLTVLTAMTLNGAALAFFGIVQKLTYNGKIYWQVELSQGGIAFGPFVNRNNSAGYLLMGLAASVGLIAYLWRMDSGSGPGLIVSKEIPIWRQIREHLTLLLADLTASKIASLTAFVLIAAGIVSGLSRGGVTAMLFACFATFMLYGMARRPKAGILLFIPMLLVIVLLTSWIGFYDQLIERFNALEELDSNARYQTWHDTSFAVKKMGLFGAGLGAYPMVQRLYGQEIEHNIFAFAENQFVQSMIDAGIPGLILLLSAVVYFAYLAIFILYRGSSPLTVAIGTFAVFLGSSQIVASCFDFGWYIPANTVLLAISVGLISQHGHALATRLKKWSLLQMQGPAILVSIVILLAFTGCLLTSIAIYRQANSEDHLLPRNFVADYENMPLEKTESKIAAFNVTLETSMASQQLNQLADLWIHRARLLYLEKQLESLSDVSPQGISTEQLTTNIWQLSSLTGLEAQMADLRSRVGRSASNSFRNEPFISDSLMPCVHLMYESLKQRPIQPELQIKLGQILILLGAESEGVAALESGIRHSPNNVDFRVMVGRSNLFLGNLSVASGHFRRALELDPKQVRKIFDLIKGRSGVSNIRIPDSMIAENVVPDDPELIYQFAIRYLDPQDELRNQMLRHAAELLANVSLADGENVLLKANVLLTMGDIEGGIEQLENATIATPGNHSTRYRLATLLMENDRLDEAMSQARRLHQSNERDKNYERLIRNIQKKIDGKRFSDKEE